jgi:alcohol dehydrogenase (cytochrome c)
MGTKRAMVRFDIKGKVVARIAAWAILAVFPAWVAAAAPVETGKDWPGFFGDSRAMGYSPLDQINRDNVRHLAPVWAFSTGETGLGATPIVVDGVLYLLAPNNHLFALDGATGKLLWTSARAIPKGQLGGVGPSTGLAFGFGLVFEGTRDNHLVAVDAKTGRDVWDVQVEDYRQCKCTTSFAPILAGDKVIVGARGDIAQRAYIAAFDAKTGKELWRFWTIPGPGEPGNDSWPEGDWKLGGASTWLGGSYDPELDLIFWGVGNPQPMLNADARKGDNLYSDSVVAIDAKTGKLKWHFQEIPNDALDFDSAPEPTLIDVVQGGVTRKLVLHANKSGFTYILDRATGKFIAGWPHADKINWTKGLDPAGKPIDAVRTELGVDKLICPSLYGSRAGNHSSYSPRTGWWYNTSFEVCAYLKGMPPMASREGDMSIGGFIRPVRSPDTKPFIAAFDPLTGQRKWTHETGLPNVSPLTATGGDLVFGGDVYGNAYALDAKTGKTLWSFSTGSGISGSAITYSVGGRQYVAIPSGMTGAPATLIATLWPELSGTVPPIGSTLFVFALPETGKPETGKAVGDAH